MNKAKLNYSERKFLIRSDKSKNIEGLFFWGLKYLNGLKLFLGKNNIKNELSSINLLRVQILSQIWQLKNNRRTGAS